MTSDKHRSDNLYEYLIFNLVCLKIVNKFNCKDLLYEKNNMD